MISLKDVLEIHEKLIIEFGGSKGIRDNSSLISALNRPFQTFDGKELYPSPVSKAASLIESILTNHPFIDGNKRTGYVLMRILLINYDLDINATENDKYDFVINIASGNFTYEMTLEWLSFHVVNL